MSAPDSLRRTKVTVHPDEQRDDYEGGRIRVYFDPMSETPPAPSVSVIKGLREDPEKAENLEGWRQQFDGQSQWGRPWYKDQMAFKGYRGTIVHFVILDELGEAGGDTYYHDVGEKSWGREEYEAEYALKKWSKKAPSANTDEVPYAPRANQYDGEHAWDKAMRGTRWAARAFYEHMIADGPLTPENVLGVEQYVWDREYGYGGQYDLLYEDDHGDVVLADIKTSSGLRFDAKLQSAAYKRAVDSDPELPDVDTTEIIRLHPDSETVEVSRADEWDRTLEGLTHEFLALCDQAQHVSFQQTLAQAAEKLREQYDDLGDGSDDGESIGESDPEDEAEGTAPA